MRRLVSSHHQLLADPGFPGPDLGGDGAQHGERGADDAGFCSAVVAGGAVPRGSQLVGAVDAAGLGWQRPYQESVVHHDDVPIAVRDYGGTGPSVLLLHGGGRTLTDWGLMVPYLLTRHRVLAADLRNHGRSGDGPWDWDTVVDDIRAVIDGYALHWPAIVGHSRGGMVAAACAAAWDDCAAAVNLDGHGPGRPDQYPGLPAELVRARLAALDELARSVTPAGPISPERMQALCRRHLQLAETYGIPRELALDGWQRSLTRHPDGSYRIRPTAEADQQMQAALTAIDLLDVYGRARCPLLIYRTTRTDLVAPQLDLPDWVPELMEAHHRGLLRELTQLAHDRAHVTVRAIDATHWLILERPADIAEDILGFLEQTARQPPPGMRLTP